MDTATPEYRLLNDFQRNFPLCASPFAELGRRLGLSEDSVLDGFNALQQADKISRIGAVFAPHCFGASTLAAMCVPPHALEEVAARVSRFSEVNHNYAREHRYNLWFVVTAASLARLQAVLREIHEETQHVADTPLLSLPLLQAFYIDLGFPLNEALPTKGKHRADTAQAPTPALALSEKEKRLLAALQDGLPCVPRPFEQLAAQAQMTEECVIASLTKWLEQGAIRRFGVIVRHRALGYEANAMVVHDVPDDEAGAIGRALAEDPGITLCYQRARVSHTFEWPYNLFCMIHGRARDEVAEYVEHLRTRYGLRRFAHDVLFSRGCFKQTGARYA